jgi:GntR family histidine utilization transcriptional repressor
VTPSASLSYRDVKAEILNRVRAGLWPLGEVIPGEEALAAEFGCARVTVNRALRELASEGVVERKRKAGTRVVQGRRRAARIEIPLIRMQIEERGAAYRYVLLSHEILVAPETARARLSIEPGMEALHLRCLHFADGSPYQLEDRWINLDAVPGAWMESFEKIGPNEWLVREKPLSEAEHTFLATNAGEDEAALLGLASHDALFVIERRTWLADQTITWVKLIHPGASFRMTSRS